MVESVDMERSPRLDAQPVLNGAGAFLREGGSANGSPPNLAPAAIRKLGGSSTSGSAFTPSDDEHAPAPAPTFSLSNAVSAATAATKMKSKTRRRMSIGGGSKPRRPSHNSILASSEHGYAASQQAAVRKLVGKMGKDETNASFRDSAGSSANGRTSPTKPPDEVKHESYKFDEEESKLHLDWRVETSSGSHERELRIVSHFLTAIIGIGLGLLVAGITLASGAIHQRISMLVQLVTWNGVQGDSPRMWVAFAVYALTQCGLILIASMLTYRCPSAANSGLPKIKSFLNGTHLKEGLLTRETFFAKVIGICLVVGSGVPLGREVRLGRSLLTSGLPLGS